MTLLKQNLITIGGALLASIVFIQPITNLYIQMFGSSGGGSVLSVIDSEIFDYIIMFFFVFPFFLTLIEFSFKKPFRKRVPYLIIIALLILLGIADVVYSLQVIGIAFIAALPGSLYYWIRDGRMVKK